MSSYSDIEVLYEPYKYLLQVPGKGIRERLIACFNFWLQLPEEPLEAIKNVIQILHNSSLLIDDIEDNSKLRRGIPVAHAIYGIPWTINTGNYMYFIAMQECYKLNNPQANQALLEEIIAMHHGQGFDIFWRDGFKCPSEEDYKKMVLDKTGGLFRLTVRLMQAFSQDKRDYMGLVNLLSYYFQVRDDYMNLQSSVYAMNKSFCEDLTEGKFSFPIIHAINSNPSDSRLLNILRQRTEDVELKKYAVKYMKQCGSFKYTIEVLNQTKTQLENNLKDFPENRLFNKILNDLHNTLQDAARQDQEHQDQEEEQLQNVLHKQQQLQQQLQLQHLQNLNSQSTTVPTPTILPIPSSSSASSSPPIITSSEKPSTTQQDHHHHHHHHHHQEAKDEHHQEQHNLTVPTTLSQLDELRISK